MALGLSLIYIVLLKTYNGLQNHVIVLANYNVYFSKILKTDNKIEANDFFYSPCYYLFKLRGLESISPRGARWCSFIE